MKFSTERKFAEKDLLRIDRKTKITLEFSQPKSFTVQCNQKFFYKTFNTVAQFFNLDTTNTLFDTDTSNFEQIQFAKLIKDANQETINGLRESFRILRYNVLRIEVLRSYDKEKDIFLLKLQDDDPNQTFYFEGSAIRTGLSIYGKYGYYQQLKKTAIKFSEAPSYVFFFAKVYFMVSALVLMYKKFNHTSSRHQAIFKGSSSKALASISSNSTQTSNSNGSPKFELPPSFINTLNYFPKLSITIKCLCAKLGYTELMEELEKFICNAEKYNLFSLSEYLIVDYTNG